MGDNLLRGRSGGSATTFRVARFQSIVKGTVRSRNVKRASFGVRLDSASVAVVNLLTWRKCIPSLKHIKRCRATALQKGVRSNLPPSPRIPLYRKLISNPEEATESS